MDRVIKFRGKNSFLEKWIYAEIQFSGLELFDNAVKEETIGQFTGLHDKNGTEIYEGDILRSEEYKDVKHVVVYDTKNASFMAVLINQYKGSAIETKCHITQEWIDNFPKIVIGNIHDNPELLEE